MTLFCSAQAKSEVSQLERQKAAAVAALEASEDQLLERGLTRAKTHQEAVEDERERLSALKIARQNYRALQDVTIPSELRQAEIQYENRQRAYASFEEALQHKQNIYDAGISRSRNSITALEQDLARAELNLQRTTITAMPLLPSLIQLLSPQ